MQINREVLRHAVDMCREHGEKGLSVELRTWTASQKIVILEDIHRNYFSC